MLKYKHIINVLTEKQKIRLLADLNCLSEVEYRSLGIPGVQFANFGDWCKQFFPSPVSLANSFDHELISSVCEDVYARMASEGVNCVTVPSAKLKINPSRYALSEDPLVCGKMAGEYIVAANKANISCALPDFSIRDDEAQWLDKTPDGRVLAEYIVKPHRYAGERGVCNGIFIDAGSTVPEYAEVNHHFANIAKDKDTFSANGYSIRKNIPAEETVHYIKNGQICVGGSATVIKTALNKYEKLKNAIPHGRATVDELEREVQKGTAISMESIDEALDRIIEFAFVCNAGRDLKAKPDNKVTDELCYKAACNSAVLLENRDKTLPITSKRRKIGIIGDIIVNYEGLNDPQEFNNVANENADSGQKNSKQKGESTSFAQNEFVEKIKGYGYKTTGFARGYDMSKERDEYSDLSARDIAKKSDYVIVFVGTNPETEKYITRTERITLPANQIALLDDLQEFGKKIIVVMSGNYTIEVDFAKNFAGLILAPLNTKQGVMAAIDMVLGKASPQGKLSSALYEDTKTLLLKSKAYRNIWNTKQGGYIGYRYYDSANYSLGYPFGYGLSYTKFSYSHISLHGRKLTLTVKNTGKMAGGELVQVYVGMENSALLRPKRELVEYCKVSLAPGEKKTVTIDIPPFTVYDEENKKFVEEKGVYALYVGSSLDDIRYTKKMHVGDVVLTPDNKRISHYLQSESNIIDDKYTLEANYKLMKKTVRNIIFGVGALLLAAVLFMFTALSEVKAPVLMIVSIVLVFASMSFFALEFYDRKMAHIEERKRIDEANDQQFADAEHIDVYAAENMFIEEFDKTEVTVENQEVHYVRDNDNDFFVHVNKELTFSEACYDFNTFAAEKGFKFAPDAIREIFASIASSRIIILKDTNDEQYKTLIMLLCEYFDCPVSIDYVSDRYINEESVLFRDGYDGERIKTNVLKGIENAYNEKQNIQILSLADVSFSDISNYFVSFARYARNPSGGISIEARNEKNNEVSYVIPQNTWMFIKIRNGEKICNIPEYLADVSTTVKIDYTKSPASGVIADVRKFKFYQLDYLLDKCKNVYEFSEDTWKKIDKLEEYTNLHAKFHLGNKICTGIEKYSSTFIACEGDMNTAIDKAVASKLLPYVILTVNSNRNKEARGLGETLDAIFGEENTAACRNMLSTSGAEII